jgi:hypothetical protein
MRYVLRSTDRQKAKQVVSHGQIQIMDGLDSSRGFLGPWKRCELGLE